MIQYATPEDTPCPMRPTRIVIYAMGIKIYGQIPYILQKRLRAEFQSHTASFALGGKIAAPTYEPNYTIVPWRRDDGKPHRERDIDSLIDWLYSDLGFQWSVAEGREFFRSDLAMGNIMNDYPRTFVPGGIESKVPLRQLLSGGNDEQ